MVAGGVTGGADLADLVHLADGLTLADQDAGHVGVQRLVAVAVVDFDVVAVRVVPTGGNDGAGVGSVNRRAVGGAVRFCALAAWPSAWWPPLQAGAATPPP